MLPKEDILASYINQSFIFFQPKESIGGDFYYVKKISDELIIICGDCTGHGVPGAMMTMISLNIIHNIVENKKITSPKQILKEIANEFRSSFRNEYNSTSINDGMELSVCTYKRAEDCLSYAGAGRPIIRSSENTIERVHPNPEGINGNIHNDIEFIEHNFKIKPGDRFYLYTDGIVDQFGGPKGKKFMTKNLINLISETANFNIKDQFPIIRKALNDWKGNEEQVDDILMISFGF